MAKRYSRTLDPEKINPDYGVQDMADAIFNLNCVECPWFYACKPRIFVTSGHDIHIAGTYLDSKRCTVPNESDLNVIFGGPEN